MTIAGRCPGRYLTLVAGVFAAGCATSPAPAPPPPSYVVLLPDPDGTVGAVTVHAAGRAAVLDRAWQGVNLDGSSSGPYAADQQKVTRDFRAALAARPALPVSFTLYFETATTRLTPASQALLPRVLDAVRDHPVPDVSVIGHTDTVGSAEDNEKLGLDRAQAVAGLITAAGLKAHSLIITSHGEGNLLVPTPDNTPEERNRRVEITVR
jgi:peptidoglycan-associated lipoprotein